MRDANLDKSAINDVILVGVSTRIELVQTMLTNHFDGRAPHKFLNPDLAVAEGATILAIMLENGEDVSRFEDVTPLSMGIKVFEATT